MRRFTILIILRITLIIGNVLVLSWIFLDIRLFFNQIILSLLLIGQIIELIHFVNHTNRELAKLFYAIKYSDFSVSFKDGSLGKSFRELQESLTSIIQSFKDVKIEKEVQYQFLQMLVKQIHIGIITLENDKVVLINPTAEALLNISGIRTWKLIRQINPAIAHELELIGDNGRKLIELNTSSTSTHQRSAILSVDVSTLVILDKPHKLITFHDINSEIEQKEIEAWHKLIRILTHEIMNSVTPVSSLTETMQSMLSDKNGNPKKVNQLTDETISDIRFSLNTIHKRSEGLLHFVENYRKLTRIPKPVMEEVNTKDFLLDLEKLMTHELNRQGIQLTVETDDHALTLSFDRKLIEQVMLNLITNSTHALASVSDKKIQLRAYTLAAAAEPVTTLQGQHARGSIIEVTDNGRGIPEKELKEIFIPFFSTKKEGSGIGLSLSKQIMSLHGGTIKVKSKVNEGTSFQLVFRS